MDKPQRHPSRGLTLLELTLTLGLAGILVFLGLQVATQMSRTQEALNEKSDAEKNVTSLFYHILKVGRAAGAPPNPSPRSCSIVNGSLQCEIDLGRPPTGNTTSVRFRFDAQTNQVLYEELTNQAPPVWTTRTTYFKITGFAACGDAEMLAKTCPIPDDKINTLHLANLGPQPPLSPPALVAPASTPSNRFFRFELKGQAERPDARKVFSREISIQSAFFVRNPPFPGDPNVAYQFGTK